MYQASDVMSTSVISISPEATAEEAIESLLLHGISGAPVLDESRRVIGIISEFQLLAVIYEPGLKQHLVNELMTKAVLSVQEQTPLSAVADLFIAHRVRRLPVLRDGRLVGLISRPDVLRYIINDRKRSETAVPV